MEDRQERAADAIEEAADDDVGDDLLRLVCASCHPSLSAESRVALTLRILGRPDDGRDRASVRHPGDDRRAAHRTFGDKGGTLAREAFHDNRKRVGRKKGKTLLKLRGELIERTFTLACETRAHRRVRLRGRDNARSGSSRTRPRSIWLVMRTLFGYGTPREMAAEIAAAWNVLLRLILASAVDSRRRFIGTALLPTEDAPIVACSALAAATGA